MYALLRLGLPDRFIDHGDQAQLLAELGLDRDGIVRAVRAGERQQPEPNHN
jgi:1-deoxy-D-xylulose-5-phosphate synthase